MNNYIEYFTNYIFKNYDMNDELISLKYYHSLRVAKLMALLAQKLNMSDEDITLAFKIGLCHDLGRFYEVIHIGKFNNVVFDHGAYSNKILYNDGFINYMDVGEHLLFRKAIYNHNKKDVTNDLTKREELFVHMLRDIDKLDILDLNSVRKKYIIDDKGNPTIINNYLNDEMIDIKDIKNRTDSTILYLSFLKDLYYKASHDMAINNNYLDNFTKVINVENKDLYDNLKNKIYEKRGKMYVR